MLHLLIHPQRLKQQSAGNRLELKYHLILVQMKLMKIYNRKSSYMQIIKGVVEHSNSGNEKFQAESHTNKIIGSSNVQTEQLQSSMVSFLTFD